MEFILVAALLLAFGIWSRRQFGAQQDRIKALETSVDALSDQLQRLSRKVSSQAPGEVSPVEPSGAKQASMPEAIVEPPAEATAEEEAVHLPSAQVESEVDPLELYKATLEPGGEADADRAMAEAAAQEESPAAAEAPQGDDAATGPEPAGDQPAEVALEAVRPEKSTDHPIPQQAARRAGQTSFEQRLSTNWLVWIGGVALALAGVFLVRYIAEQGWLSPATRCFLGGLFGVTLIVAGEFIRRRPLQRAIAAIRPDYVPQALSSAGLVTVFGSVYLAYAFYDLIPPSWSFAALGSIAIAAFGLSLVEGAFVALIGLLGAALTPALISTDNPSPWGFFSYLGVIALTSVAVADRRKWHWLPELAIMSYAGWGVVWTAQIFTNDDVLPIGLTSGVVALAALAMAVRSTPHLSPWKQHGRLIAISAATVAWTGLAVAALSAAALALLTNFSPEAHWVVLAFAISAVAIARYAPAFGQAAPVMAVLSLLVFTLNYVDVIALDNLAEKTFGWPAPTHYFIENYRHFSLHGALISLVFYFGGMAALSRQKGPEAIAISSGFLSWTQSLKPNTVEEIPFSFRVVWPKSISR